LTYSLLFGAIFVPTHDVEAGFLSSLSSIFGGQVYAESSASMLQPVQPDSTNLQDNQNALSSAVSLSSRGTDSNSSTSIAFDDSNSALVPTASLGADTIDGSDYEADFYTVYTVRPGDTWSGIADIHEVSINTVLWENERAKTDKLVAGEVLLIPPISGKGHKVEKGQTCQSIANKYQVDVKDIINYNGMEADCKLAVGEEIFVPGAEVSSSIVSSSTSKKSSTSSVPKTPLKNIAGYFINPVLGYIKTQGLHGKNAVDLAAPIGTPVRAAASGTVTLARMGWNGAYGNMVIIQHPNGTRTLYSHLSKLASTTGQNVSQGDVIGYVGNSGRVRAAKGGNGAHLHFEVYGAKNPGVDKSWKQ